MTTTEADILDLFHQWNSSLQSGDPLAVNALYAPDAVLLPTVSNIPRLNAQERIDYFKHFLASQPVGKLDSQRVHTGCNSALLSGLYTFKFVGTGAEVAARYSFAYTWDGERWLISSHHSSVLPET
ncbi:DUF4440 domain-containing protein [Pseudomonas huaxiensis]|uniref:DUF4440 domain-containing protein n=1 Tax=Pseudomonas huaxiensis TaxID=2213017 RepID=UPI001CDC5820|nr:DUF4440 domain-containing protein [Pseudomonas huaxiensis]